MTLRPTLPIITLASILAATTLACASSPLEPGGTVQDQPSAQAQPAPAVTKLSPTSGPVGTTITVTGRGFAARNTATFGAGYIRDVASTDGETLTFVVPDGLDLCAPDGTAPCAGAHPRTKAGAYTISVMIDGRKSNAVTFTVTP